MEENPYKSPETTGEPPQRDWGFLKWAKRGVIASWLVAIAAVVYAIFHAGDGDPHQWGSAIFSVLSLMWAFSATFAYVVSFGIYFVFFRRK
jgi:hypothetical protein